MKYQISIFNQHSGQKTIRYIVDAARVRQLTEKVWEEIEQHAFDVVLVELVK